MNAINQIFLRMKTNNTLLCCGLDPDLKKMPREILGKSITNEEKVFEFLKAVVDVTAQHVCAYKAQKAFFDVLPRGHDILKNIISYIHEEHEGIPVLVDCKIGDIDNTMAVYTYNIFTVLNADGIVVNPYMGDDVMLQLMELNEKAIIVLVKTSNVSGGIIQDVILKNGLPFWRYVLDIVVNRWNVGQNMIPVISSTSKTNLLEIRALIPDKMLILFAGIGTQGGNPSGLRQLLNSEGIGVFVNSSRSILYPKSKKEWRVAIGEAARNLKDNLNRERDIR